MPIDEDEFERMLGRMVDDMIQKGPIEILPMERNVGEKMRQLMEQNVKLIAENRILAKKLLGE